MGKINKVMTENSSHGYTEGSESPLTDNKLIDKFMGANPIEDIPYDKDWNLLMPVVEKIKNNEYSRIDTQGIRRYERIVTYLGAVDIKETHREVVEFIKWYENKENQ